MRAVVVAGGTGGHIYPAIAIINKIKEKEPDSEFIYIGTNDRMEKDIIPKLGIEFVGIDMKGLDRKKIFAAVQAAEEITAQIAVLAQILLNIIYWDNN